MTLIVLTCALGVAILTAAASAVAVWRVRNSADQRVADAVQQLAAGMQETMRDLASAVETAQSSRADLHVSELAASLATAAYQTMAGQRLHDPGERPFQLDRCHALDETKPAVARFYPKWYRGTEPIAAAEESDHH